MKWKKKNFAIVGDENHEIGCSFPENNNNEIFTNFLKLAIDTDRSERLNEMIKTTGYQLYNTFIGGNNPDATRSAADNWASQMFDAIHCVFQC